MSKLSEMNDLINKLADEPFKYGKNDCFMFAARLAIAWHDDNPLYKDLYERHLVYKTETKAREYMMKFGGIERLVTGTLGYSVDPIKAEDGDVATAEVAKGEIALGFVFNNKAIFKAKKKVVQLPLKKCRKAWKL